MVVGVILVFFMLVDPLRDCLNQETVAECISVDQARTVN
jgi:hypothetical protein